MPASFPVPCPSNPSASCSSVHKGPFSGISRTFVLSFFLFSAVVLCIAAVRYSGSPSPPQRQVPAALPLEDQLTSIRTGMAQLQGAVEELQRQRQQQMLDRERGQQRQPQLQQDGQWPPSLGQRQLARRQMALQPMKRMISWQPMKREDAGLIPAVTTGKEQVMLAVERELMDVIRAGERLGVYADEILAHLRARNGL